MLLLIKKKPTGFLHREHIFNLFLSAVSEIALVILNFIVCSACAQIQDGTS